MAARDRGIRVAREYHLTLLGELEPPGHRSWSLSSYSAVGRATTATERSTASMKDGQPDAVSGCPPGQRRLRLIEGQARRGWPDLLGRVRIAKHHLEPAAGRFEATLDWFQLEHDVEDFGRAANGRLGFEQWDHVQDRG